MLCDAGGGTVDLISYTVQTLDPILQLEEGAAGSGERIKAQLEPFVSLLFILDLVTPSAAVDII